jgi:hypothetical protein
VSCSEEASTYRRTRRPDWNVGEAAGALAPYCLDHETTRELYETQPRCLLFQQLLVSMGVQLHRPEEIQTEVR